MDLLGAALCAYYDYLQHPREISTAVQDAMQGAYLGPQFSQIEIEKRLRYIQANFEVLNDEALIAYTAQALADEKPSAGFKDVWNLGSRARRPIDSSRSTLSQNAKKPQSQSEISRIFSSLRAFCACRRSLGMSLTLTSQSLYVVGGRFA